MADTERIRARAHEIWEAEGRPEGRELEHWNQAEQEMAASETGPDSELTPERAQKETSGDAPAGAEPAGGPALQQGTNAPGPRG